jgi:hypothetical protein
VRNARATSRHRRALQVLQGRRREEHRLRGRPQEAEN